MEKETASNAKKKLFSVIYGRSAIILLLLVVQVLIMMLVLGRLQEYWMFVYGAFTVMGVIAVVYIINSEGCPEYKMAWTLCILALPVVGTFFYLYVKSELGTLHVGRRLAKRQMEVHEFLQQDEEVITAMRSSREANTHLSHYLYHQLNFPTYGNTKLEYYPLGEDKFRSMVRELKKARKFIFMEYFIVEEGYMWNTLLKILEEKAAEGVEVRFMFDGMCSISLVPYDFPKKLKKSGIQCKAFNKLRPVVSTVQNNRDHRKICVIDGKVGFTGGVNLADEYINKKERFGHWKDTAIMLKGNAVQSLTVMFLQMWNVDEKGTEQYENYLTPQTTGFDRSMGYVIPYGDNPYDKEDVGEEVYLHILNHAKNYVHIMTPYLILDYDMISTLTRVAKSGIEVVIIMPHIPDKPYAFDVAKTFYKELIQAGVQIYEYLPGFVHAKVFVADDDTATVGTINLDYRSLYLHFECGVFIYHNPEVYRIEKDFQETLEKCAKVSLTEVQHRSLFTKLRGQILRLFAPLM